MMREKKIALIATLFLFTFFLGYTLAALDFFGFLTNMHALNFAYLFASFIAWHFISMVVFFLDLENSQHQQRVYIITSSIFGVVFLIFSQDIISTLLVTIFFFFFLITFERRIKKRAQLFIKFSAKEILLPIIKSGFLFLLIILVGLGYLQSLNRAKNSQVISASMVRLLIKPMAYGINKQLSVQIQRQLAPQLEQTIGIQDRQQIVEYALKESIEAMTEGTVRQQLGINPENIPLEKVIVYENGEIDVTPVLEAMIPDITRALNKMLEQYQVIIPFVFAVFVLLLASPLLSIVELLLLPFTILIIKILLSANFVHLEKESVEREVLKL